MSEKSGGITFREAVDMIEEKLRKDRLVKDAAPGLLRVVEAMLLFHSGGPWTQAKDSEFNLLLMPLVGREPEATIKGLCDAGRAALARARGGA